MKKRTFKSKVNDDIHSKMVETRSDDAKKSLGIVNTVIALDCGELDTWCYRDRMDFELGDIESLGISIENKGQAQPIVVVEKGHEFKGKTNSRANYIVIAGYRRWMACKKKNIKVEAIICKFNFEEAVACLMAENEKENVSDYSKGMFFSSIIASENITQDSLHKRLNMSVTSISRYLSFSRVPKSVWEAVGDMSLVSSRTAAELASISKKGKTHVSAIIEIAEHIRSGIGAKRIISLIDNIINKQSSKNLQPIVIEYGGEVYANVTDSRISFSKKIREHESFQNIKNEMIKKLTSMIPKNQPE